MGFEGDVGFPHRVYVGDFEARPDGVGELPKELRRANPCDFGRLLSKVKHDFWTNNPCWLWCRGITYDHVMVCSIKDRVIKRLPLSKHPDTNKWIDIFDAGEFWSFHGSCWVHDVQ